MLFAVVLTGLFVWWGLRRLDSTQIWEALRAVQLLPLVGAFVAVGTGTLLRAYRWQVLLETPQFRYRFRDALGATCVGQTLNMVAFARSGDISKAAIALRDTPYNIVEITGLSLLEKLYDALALLGLLLIVAWTATSARTQLLTAAREAVPNQWVLVSVAVCIVSGALWVLRHRFAQQLAQLTDTLNWLTQVALQSGRPAVLATLGFWISAWLTQRMLLVSQQIDHGSGLALTVLAFIYLGIVPNLTPANLIPVMAMSIAAMHLFQIGPAHGITHGLLVQLVSLSMPALIAGVYLLLPRELPA